ncbi:MAG TPA: copper resistance system multicopper oxidase [Lysobacter sp.]|nr:copper resistance system multicopper oxidase [Lysobacter sp.]
MFPLTRRRFVQGLAGTALLPAVDSGAAPAGPNVLTGPQFDLTIDTLPVNFTGTARRAIAVNGSIPGPTLRMRQGDTVTLRVTNRLREQTSIHWHGLILPADMDGVPGLSFNGIAPGSTFTYRFKVNQAGTYWYHSHSRFQEQVGLYGPLVIERRAGERHAADREHVLLLSDWTDHDPEHIYATLKRQSDYYNFSKRTAADFLADVRSKGWSATVADRRMWAAMRMNPTDLADVSGYAYTYLLNGIAPAANWTGTFVPGERVRLRIINGSSMSFFDVRIPGLKLTVVAADGQDVEPVTVDELRIGTAEVYDVIVEPRDAAYTVFAQAMDRSGFARGTLAPRVGMTAEVPGLDAPVLLSMSDMGMHHEGMDHSQMSHAPLKHAPAENGPLVDMKASMVAPRLDDPGVGLRDNGRRVLTYADLATLGGPIDLRDAAREIELHLTGHMERFVWGFNGQKFSQVEPLRLTYGERLRIVLVNDTMMTHPIHLHGMWSDLEDEDGNFLVRKHTIDMPPGTRRSYRVRADALGGWAYHCHLLFHMEAGMMREVRVEE